MHSIRRSSLAPTGVLLCCFMNTAGKLNLQCCNAITCNPVDCTCKNRSGGKVKPFYKLYRVIHKSVKHFKNSQQIDYATDHGNSYADIERNSSSFFLRKSPRT